MHQADEIEGDIRVRTQAVTFPAFEGAFRNHLQQDIDTRIHHVARDVRVIAADVILLGIIVMQIFARRKIEFDNFDIGWKRTRLPVLLVIEVRVVTENAFRHWLEKALFEQAFPFRFVEG